MLGAIIVTHCAIFRSSSQLMHFTFLQQLVMFIAAKGVFSRVFSAATKGSGDD